MWPVNTVDTMARVARSKTSPHGTTPEHVSPRDTVNAVGHEGSVAPNDQFGAKVGLTMGVQHTSQRQTRGDTRRVAISTPARPALATSAHCRRHPTESKRTPQKETSRGHVSLWDYPFPWQLSPPAQLRPKALKFRLR